MKIKTPVLDKTLSIYTLQNKEGIVFDENTLTSGQKEIMEIILNRGVHKDHVLDGARFKGDICRRIHVMAHTRFGKSISIGAATAIRASVKKEKWAIIAPTTEQAQIIMDYMLDFAVNDPLIRETLRTDANLIKQERLTQRRSRNHITFKGGGEVRTYTAKNVMGFGAKNIILDEAGLISDQEESKIFRMLGDDAEDSFYLKVGNPWHNNHFKDSSDSDNFFKLNYKSKDGLKMGRLTQEYLEEAREKPNYEILYENEFPDQEAEDEHGYRPLISRATLKNAYIDKGEGIGQVIDGGDPAGGGGNVASIVRRQGQYAKILFSESGIKPLEFARKMAEGRDKADLLIFDKQGVGAGTQEVLESAKETKRKSVAVNSGMALKPEDAPSGVNPKDYFNSRAFMFWQLKKWLESGGRLERDDRWETLLKVKYRIANGKVKIIPKDELKKKYAIEDLGEADALSYTFFTGKPNHFEIPDYLQKEGQNNLGGVEPFYNDLGI
jgi:hypothetical protein